MMICPDLSPNKAVSDVELGGEDFASSLARKVCPDHLPFELEAERPHKTFRIVSNSWGSVQFPTDHKLKANTFFNYFFLLFYLIQFVMFYRRSPRVSAPLR